jgi:hypothetical protein
MLKKNKFVAVGRFTQTEFNRWGDKLRHVYMPDGTGIFDDLLRRIDEADLASRPLPAVETDIR